MDKASIQRIMRTHRLLTFSWAMLLVGMVGWGMMHGDGTAGTILWVVVCVQSCGVGTFLGRFHALTDKLLRQVDKEERDRA